jgi:peptide deformylase
MKHDDGLRLVLIEGAPDLRKKARVLLDEEIAERYISNELERTRFAALGLGLSAPQIGVDARVCNVQGIKLVNPVIVERSTSTWSQLEGCLSLPGVSVVVRRATRIVVKDSQSDEPFIFNGMRARVAQHEIDHLDGVLITDHGLRIGPTEWGSPFKPVRAEKDPTTGECTVACPHCGRRYPWYIARWDEVQAMCFSDTRPTLIRIKGWRPW